MLTEAFSHGHQVTVNDPLINTWLWHMNPCWPSGWDRRILGGHRAITRTLPIASGMHCSTATPMITGRHGKVLLYLQIQKSFLFSQMATRGQGNGNIVISDTGLPSSLCRKSRMWGQFRGTLAGRILIHTHRGRLQTHAVTIFSFNGTVFVKAFMSIVEV